MERPNERRQVGAGEHLTPRAARVGPTQGVRRHPIADRLDPDSSSLAFADFCTSLGTSYQYIASVIASGVIRPGPCLAGLLMRLSSLARTKRAVSGLQGGGAAVIFSLWSLLKNMVGADLVDGDRRQLARY
jgi:hypothetical protein